MSALLKTVLVIWVIVLIAGVTNGYAEELNENHLRISMGGDTTIQNHPHQVQIRIGTTFCGGFIVSKSYVMTAAHCVLTAAPSTIAIRAGTTTLDTGGSTFTVTTVTKHALFDPITYDYDFALLKVNPDFVFSDTIKAIDLPNQDENLPIIGPIVLAGWGYKGPDLTTLSPALQEVRLTMVPRKICNSLYQGKSNITERMFCVGKMVLTTKGACQGDAGTPALYNKVAVGVMAFVDSCGSRRYPTVFGKISSVIIWIRGLIGA